MFFILIQLDFLRGVHNHAVHPDPDKAAPADFVKNFGVFALLAPDQGRQDLEPGALSQGSQLVHHLLHGLPGDGLAAIGAVGPPRPGV
ncbi:MAG: hypothetical protein BWY80_01385 [Firmicutes bacterium ADurb.Bin456]|nr:MAG: hypothetical protein BWY80_01385 [Firmicutes bacterium ADurb.Bin456]